MKGRARMSKRCKRRRRTFSVRVARVASMLSTHVSVVIWARKGQAGLKDRDQGLPRARFRTHLGDGVDATIVCADPAWVQGDLSNQMTNYSASFQPYPGASP